MAGSTRWGRTQDDGKHGQQYPQGRRKGSIATAATRHDVSPPSAREIERTSLVKTNLLAANDLLGLPSALQVGQALTLETRASAV